MERRLAQIEESVARYLSQLDTADRQTAAGEAPSEELVARTTRLKEKLTKLEEEVKRLKAIEKEMLATPDQHILVSPTYSVTFDNAADFANCGWGNAVDQLIEYAKSDITSGLCEKLADALAAK